MPADIHSFCLHLGRIDRERRGNVYEVSHVVNSILNHGLARGRRITPKQLHKLLYFHYKDYLQKTDEPLFYGQFQPAITGPVSLKVVKEYKRFNENDYITRFCPDSNGKEYYIPMNDDSDPVFNSTLSDTWEKYSKFTGDFLSDLTHTPGSAWDKARKANLPFLKDEDIKAEPDLLK